jgi:predicted secreted protein
MILRAPAVQIAWRDSMSNATRTPKGKKPTGTGTQPQPTAQGESRAGSKPGAPAKTKPRRKRLLTVLAVCGALLVLGMVLTAGGFAFAATQESHDTFCASCHTQPESTFFQRATAAQPSDLAIQASGSPVALGLSCSAPTTPWPGTLTRRCNRQSSPCRSTMPAA